MIEHLTQNTYYPTTHVIYNTNHICAIVVTIDQRGKLEKYRRRDAWPRDLPARKLPRKF